MTGRSWVIAVVVALLVVGLIAYARGPEHHHGQQVDETGVVHVPIQAGSG